MKFKHSNIIASLVFICFYCNHSNADTSVKNSAAYLNVKKTYSQHPGKYDYIMFGDSITKNGKWNNLIPGYLIGNRGISGDDTSGMLDRINDIERTGAKTVFIMAGTNDVTRKVPPEEIAKNIILMTNHMKQKNINVVIQSTILSGDKRKRKNTSINKINDLLKAFSGKSGTPFLDLNSILSPNGVLKMEYTSDGTHLNTSGYEVWSKILRAYIDSSIKNR
ncbi:GDSL-type esterase/lipase family protein [Klebsiella aerogenes]|nr:hypothetical protein [Klebsiella aerogenes]HCT7428738.1 hypothetical protein [Klebsiella aerogenes]